MQNLKESILNYVDILESKLNSYKLIIQSDRKFTQPIPDTCSVCQKINYIGIRTQKQCYI
jgi:hypothetical protein